MAGAQYFGNWNIPELMPRSPIPRHYRLASSQSLYAIEQSVRGFCLEVLLVIDAGPRRGCLANRGLKKADPAARAAHDEPRFETSIGVELE